MAIKAKVLAAKKTNIFVKLASGEWQTYVSEDNSKTSRIYTPLVIICLVSAKINNDTTFVLQFWCEYIAYIL